MLKSLLTLFLCLFVGQSVFASKIDTTETVLINGAKHFISIQAEDNAKPLLFYLHGGPGAAVSAHKAQVTADLEKDFIVIHWDQRASGKTAALNNSQEAPTLALMKKDAEDMLAYLLKKFGREKAVIVANSWGTVLGFHLAQKQPEHVTALIAVSPIVNMGKSQQIDTQRLIVHFEKEDNIEAVKQIKAISNPIQTATDIVTQYRWQSAFDGQIMTDKQVEQMLPYFESWAKVWMPLYTSLYKIDQLEAVPHIDCTVYFIVGNKDFTANYKLSESFYNQLKAPKKELFWIDGAGHDIESRYSKKMQRIIADIQF